jgi:hypothetical protein
MSPRGRSLDGANWIVIAVIYAKNGLVRHCTQTPVIKETQLTDKGGLDYSLLLEFDEEEQISSVGSKLLRRLRCPSPLFFRLFDTFCFH